jgi:hypothetical protein
MIEWNEQQQMIQKMVRDFVAKEVVPNLDDIEYNGVPPYDILRKMIKTFGMDVMATQNYEKQIAREKAAAENGDEDPGEARRQRRLHHQRQQDLDHQRPLRRHHRADLQAG